MTDNQNKGYSELRDMGYEYDHTFVDGDIIMKFMTSSTSELPQYKYIRLKKSGEVESD